MLGLPFLCFRGKARAEAVKRVVWRGVGEKEKGY